MPYRFVPLLFAGLLLTSTPLHAQARVAVVIPQAASFGERFSLSGTLTARRSAALSPRVDGLVARLHVEAGDHIEAGQPLLQLDTTVAEQALARAVAASAQARAAAEEASRQLREGESLQQRRFIPASQVDSLRAGERLALAALASAQAAEREQRALLERHALPAPFAGVVAERLVEVGEWAARGTPVLRLVALDTVWLDLRVPQERHADLAGDIEIKVHPDALPGSAFPARVLARVPVGEADGRTFLLRLAIEDAQGRLMPGTSARAEISLPAGEPALAVPRDALLRQPDGGYSLFVVVEEGGRLLARQRSVRVLRDQGERVAVASGLSAGERVVVRGNEQLRDGDPVQVSEAP